MEGFKIERFCKLAPTTGGRRCHDLMYRARSRDREHRIVAQVVRHQGVAGVVASCPPLRERCGSPRTGNKVRKVVGAMGGR